MLLLSHPPPQCQNLKNVHLCSAFWDQCTRKAAALCCYGLPGADWSRLGIVLGVLVWQRFELKPTVSFAALVEGLPSWGLPSEEQLCSLINPSVLALLLINVMLLMSEKWGNATSSYLNPALGLSTDCLNFTSCCVSNPPGQINTAEKLVLLLTKFWCGFFQRWGMI